MDSLIDSRRTDEREPTPARRVFRVDMAVAGLVAALLSALPARAETSCASEVGPAQARGLVRRCIEISPATHPPCNAANSCEMIRSEIRRGCEFAGDSAPGWCKTYTQP